MKCRGLLYKYPFSQSTRLIASPIPELAPVTIAALLMIYVLLVHSLC